MNPAGVEAMMTEQDEKRSWSVPVAVDAVPEGGRRIELHPDATVRAALADLANVQEVSDLDATFDVSRHGRGGLHVTGHVDGTVRQTCVVSLEPMTSTVSESVDLVFEPTRDSSGADGKADTIVVEGAEPPEPLVDGQVDLGAIATEFLLLGIDPYPRRPDAHFEPSPVGERSTDHPFAALKALKSGHRS